jgi:hypothetical protein
VLQAVASMPEVDKTQPQGDQEFGTLEIDLGLEAGKAAEYARQLREHAEVMRRVLSGDLSALFIKGTIVIRHGRREITAFLHFYSSMLIGGLWNDSQSFHWRGYSFEGKKLVATGESRRFAYMEHWEIEVVPEGIAVTIWIEARERIDVEEYHASIVLKPEYTRWETEFESGEYPPFEPGLNDWRHANRLYKIGNRATALSSMLPSVTLTVTSGGLPFRMTAINTGYFENARVLQALRTAETGRLFFEKGRHLYFSGIISVDPEKKV